MKDVLIITYHFPPFRTSGVYRHLKFSKYLWHFDWRPLIITSKNPSKKRIDLALMKDVLPGLPIYHTYTFEAANFQDWVIQLKDRAWSRLRRSTNERPRLFKAMNKLLGTFLMVPDDKIGWIPHTSNKALQLMKQNNILAFCTTSPPHSTHLIGLWLKRTTGKPWIADFRDPWTHSFMKQSLLNSLPFRKKLEIQMERMVLQSCDKIMTASPGIKRHFLRTHGASLDAKIEVLTNGYDDADFIHLESSSSNRIDSKFVITHIGIVYPGKSRAFLTSLKALIEQNRAFRRDVLVKFVGNPSKTNMDLLADLNLEDYVKIEGFHRHDIVVKDMLFSDILLLMVGKEKNWIPGKLFEYMRAGKPIFVVGQHGDAAEIALRSGLGTLVSDDDTQEIQRKLLHLYLQRKRLSTLVRPNRRYIKSFDRIELTRRFSHFLDQAADSQA